MHPIVGLLAVLFFLCLLAMTGLIALIMLDGRPGQPKLPKVHVWSGTIISVLGVILCMREVALFLDKHDGYLPSLGVPLALFVLMFCIPWLVQKAILLLRKSAAKQDLIT